MAEKVIQCVPEKNDNILEGKRVSLSVYLQLKEMYK